MKNVVVIGASSGIGKELARQIKEDNHKVVIAGRRMTLLDNLYAECPNSYLPLEIDITNIEQATQQLENISQKLGKIDIVVLCSGLGGDNEQLNTEREIEIAKTNVIGFTFIVSWFYHFFEKQTYGHIAVITSIAGLRGNRVAPSYFASKAFQINYLEGLKQKSYKTNNDIIITDIRPGFVQTDMLERKNLPWTAEPTKAAQQIWINIKKRRKIAYITKRWRLIATILKVIPPAIYTRL
jgi:short-subunit dehydrogenase